MRVPALLLRAPTERRNDYALRRRAKAIATSPVAKSAYVPGSGTVVVTRSSIRKNAAPPPDGLAVVKVDQECEPALKAKDPLLALGVVRHKEIFDPQLPPVTVADV